MGIVRDIFELLDKDTLNLEDGFRKRYDNYDGTNSSIARKAAEGTLQFPLLITRSISYDTAMLITKACEVTAASFAQIVLTMNPDMDISGNKGGADYLRRFHSNIDTKDDVFGTAMHFINEDDTKEAYTQILITDHVGLKVAEEDLRTYGVDFRTGSLNSLAFENITRKNIKKYKPSEIHSILQEKLDLITEAKNGNNGKTTWGGFRDKSFYINIPTAGPGGKKINTQVSFKYEDIGKGKNPSKQDIEKFAKDYLKHINDTAKDLDEFIKGKNKVSQTKDKIALQKELNKLKKLEREADDIERYRDRPLNKYDVDQGIELVHSRDILLNNDVRKANELTPTLLHIRVIARDGDKLGGRYVDFIIGIKATMHPIPSEEMIHEITDACRYHDEIFRFIRWTTGEISFFKDLILNLRDSRSAVSREQGGGSPWWNRLKRMRALANIKARFFLSNRMLPNTSVVITQQEVDYIKNTFGFNLNNPKFVEDVMTRYYLLTFCIVDESAEVAHFKYDGQYSYATYSFSGLKRENDAQAAQFKEMLKAIQRT